MNLKIGQKLKYKYDKQIEIVKVLEILPNLVGLSYVRDHESFSHWRTSKEIEDLFEIPEEEWEPEVGDECWFIDGCGYVYESDWDNSEMDHMRKNFLGRYRTKKDAEKAIEDIKNKLGK